MYCKRIYSVLMVDDSADDRFFMRLALKRIPCFKILHELTDGKAAIDYFTGHAPYDDREKYPFPDLLLLDLKMPLMTGYEVLGWLKTKHFPDLTIVVLSGSTLPHDEERSLALGAHGFWSKTSDCAKQQAMIKALLALLDRRSPNPSGSN